MCYPESHNCDHHVSDALPNLQPGPSWCHPAQHNWNDYESDSHESADCQEFCDDELLSTQPASTSVAIGPFELPVKQPAEDLHALDESRSLCGDVNAHCALAGTDALATSHAASSMSNTTGAPVAPPVSYMPWFQRFLRSQAISILPCAQPNLETR